jgi:superfamily II DNA/RNA helicase
MSKSFRELGVSRPVVDALAARKIESPFRIQELVLPDALAGLDVLGRSPTGSGKTLAFAVPIAERTSRDAGFPSALVLVPTRELAAQVTAEIEPLAKAKGLTVVAAYGGLPLHAQAKRAKHAHVLVATPGRLEDLAQRRLVDLSGVRSSSSTRPTGCSTWAQAAGRQARAAHAEEPPDDVLLGHARRRGRQPRTRVHEQPIPFEDDALPEDPGEIEHHFVAVTTASKVETLVEHLRGSYSTLVFVRTKRGAERLVTKLARHGVKASAMHGDMSQNARQRALRQFESGKVAVLVATDVAARGLDLDDITHVINYDPPAEDKGYVHRTGRTGRAGRSGTAITLVLPDQQADTSRIANRLGHNRQFEDAGLRSSRSRVVYTSRRGRRSKW